MTSASPADVRPPATGASSASFQNFPLEGRSRPRFSEFLYSPRNAPKGLVDVFIIFNEVLRPAV